MVARNWGLVGSGGKLFEVRQICSVLVVVVVCFHLSCCLTLGRYNKVPWTQWLIKSRNFKKKKKAEISISQFWRQEDRDQGAKHGQVLGGRLFRVTEGCLLVVPQWQKEGKGVLTLAAHTSKWNRYREN